MRERERDGYKKRQHIDAGTKKANNRTDVDGEWERKDEFLEMKKTDTVQIERNVSIRSNLEFAKLNSSEKAVCPWAMTSFNHFES